MIKDGIDFLRMVLAVLGKVTDKVFDYSIVYDVGSVGVITTELINGVRGGDGRGRVRTSSPPRLTLVVVGRSKSESPQKLGKPQHLWHANNTARDADLGVAAISAQLIANGLTM